MTVAAKKTKMTDVGVGTEVDTSSAILAIGEGLTFSTVTPADIEAGTTTCVARVRQIMADILTVSGVRTVENTLVPLDQIRLEIEEDFGNVANVLVFLMYLHPEKEIREAAIAQIQILEGLGDEITLNPSLAEAVVAVNVEGMDETTIRFKERTIRDFRRAGAYKDADTRTELLGLKDKLTELTLSFTNSYNNAVGQIEANVSELIGLSEEDISNFEVDESGKVILTTQRKDRFLVLEQCSNESVRERLQFAEFTLASENHNVLVEVLSLRHKIATMLGYDNWAAFALEEFMTKDTGAVVDFLSFIDGATQERSAFEIAQLGELKLAEGGSSPVIEQHDRFYYANVMKERRFSLDIAAAKEYFPYSVVRDGILNLYGELFGIEFVFDPDADVWSPDVRCYQVVEAGEIVALYYLDMHPREGKYPHAACGTLRVGVAGKQMPYVVLMCNFLDGLMPFSQVQVFFHEFGHGIHALFASKGRWAKFAGVSTEWDFVEAPSQLLEAWLQDPQIIQRISGHYKSGDLIPMEMIETILDAEDYGDGATYRRQLFLSVFAFELHTTPPDELDIPALFQDLADKYSPYPYSEDTHMWTTFGHLMSYGPAYYTYMWSLVIAKDLLTEFDQENLMNPDIAERYRRLVLEPGGSKDAADLVVAFLGRPYSFEPYKAWLKSDPSKW